MTETEAHAWLAARVPRETLERLERFVALLIEENARQNLISPSTASLIWSRHVVDSAQLLRLAPGSGTWLDLGTGAGFPGVIVALLGNHMVTLVESRAKRIDYLRSVIANLGLSGRATVIGTRVELMHAGHHDIISARAFAPLDRLFATSHHLSTPATRWILPKGRGAQAELELTQRSWQGDFTVIPSITDEASSIIVGQNVHPCGRKPRSRR